MEKQEVLSTKEEVFNYALSLNGDDLRSFCLHETDPCQSEIFWEEKIIQDFGNYPEFLISDLDWTMEDYYRLQEFYDEMMIKAEEYKVIITLDQTSERQEIHDRIEFNLAIPNYTLQGIAIAVYIANLPITLISFNDEAEIDLRELGESFIITSSEELTQRDVEDEIDNLSKISLLLNNGEEDILVSHLNILDVQGIMLAFKWLSGYNLPQWQDYIKKIYLIEDGELVTITLEELLS